MIAGARQGKMSVFKRLASFSMSQDLGVYVVPGTEITRAYGLDIEAAGMNIVASPRHASVLLIAGDMPAALCDAAAVIYAQMPRPRVLFSLTTSTTPELSPLPPADIIAGLSQQELVQGVVQLRKALAEGAFHSDVSDFNAPVLQIRIEYVCPMHPEVIQDKPGSCPKCGMNLMPREVQANAAHNHTEHKMESDDHSSHDHSMTHDTSVNYTCPMHPEVVQSKPGSCPKCGMNLEPQEKETEHDHQHMDHTVGEYTCPMHPEVIRSKPGSCPECGMNLEPREIEVKHVHQHMNHAAVEYTCPMHPEVVQSEPGSCPECGMNLEPREIEVKHDHQHMDHAAVEYTCPMHPEVVQSEPGSCPECGMNLEPREKETEHDHQHMNHTVVEYTCPMHPEVIRSEPGSCPECGMNLEPREIEARPDHQHMDHTAVEYTCPMHPEVVQSEPGSCPKCGMNLEPREKETEHDHHHTDHTVVEYTCPMHPEVVQIEPGSCPECGMNLEPREIEVKHDHQHMDHAAVEYTCPMHPEVVQSEPGSCPECGMNLEPREIEVKHDHQHMDHAAVEYTCPMHPEVVQNEPGSCPKCGMFLEPREPQSSHHDHTAMESGMNHDDSGFMSMIDVTKDLPRSGDGLPMDWLDVPFGPFIPGLPGGLLLTLTLDGDTVAAANTNTLVGTETLLCHAISANDFIEKLTALDPLTPNSYRLLACLTIENAAGIEVDTSTAKTRLVTLERERIVSHLSWLTLFAEQTGFDWLMQRASSLQKSFTQADVTQIINLKKSVYDLSKRLQRTPLLKSRTTGVGRVPADTELTLSGPVARASGISNDARSNNKIYRELGFTAVTQVNGDVRARLQLRLDEIKQSIELIQKANVSVNDTLAVSIEEPMDTISGQGQAVIETPRGQAQLQLTLDKGQVTSAQLQTPSTQHLLLIEQLTSQQELGDALVTVGSLDLSPWEIRP